MYKKVSVVLGALALMVALGLTGPTYAEPVDGQDRAAEAGTGNSHGSQGMADQDNERRGDPREEGRDTND